MTPFDEAGFPLGATLTIGPIIVDADDDEPTGLDRIAADRMRDELDDIAWCNRNGWPAGGA